MGPTNKSITVVGGVTFPQLVEVYYERARGLLDGGVDILLLETCNDTRCVKAGLVAIERLKRERGAPIPIMVSGTIETLGTMLAGQTADAFCSSIMHADLLSIGLNCGTGPEFMTDHLRTIAEMSPVRVSCYPNAGLPNDEGKYLETPTTVAAQTGALHRKRLGEYRRRLLRHHRCPYPRHRPDGRGKTTAPPGGRARTAPTIPASNWWKPKRATGR